MQGNHLFGKMRVSGFLLFNDKKIKREKSIGRELTLISGIGLLKKGWNCLETSLSSITLYK